MKPMISVAGIRGIVGESLLPEEFIRYVLAFATIIDGAPVVVGGDTRLSRSMMRHLAFAALESAGCRVHDIGLAPTPTVGLMVKELGARGGIAITASHNPAQWNAYKFFNEQGSFLSKEQNERLLGVAASGQFRRARFDAMGTVEIISDAIERHVQKVLANVDTDATRRRKFKVVVDCCNGVGGLIMRPLLDALGCDSVLFYTDVDAPFPRIPEPLPENLGELSSRVKEHNADVGFAVDPDADRLAIVDDTGRPIGEERTVTLASDAVLEKTKGPVVVNLSTTRAMDDVAARYGVELVRTPIGEANVVGEMAARGAVIGGEGNGGVIYPRVHGGRDAATGVALVLGAMARHGLSSSQLNARIPDYVMIKTKFDVTDDGPELAHVLTQAFADAEVNTQDGIKLVYPDAWLHARASGTEPVVRIFAEAPTHEHAQALIEKAQRALGK